jgi:squalene synthase HpnD
VKATDAQEKPDAAESDRMPDLPGSDQITQASQSNLALSFFSLSREKQRAMNVFYAFCRVVDDVADSTELPLAEKRRQLAQWREEIRRAYLSEPRTPLGREMAQIIRTCLIAPTLLDDVLNGVEMDLEINRFPDFALLQKYCYGVASAVGLVSLEIFGCRDPRSRDYAIALGMALQLTNILRDVVKDASFGRIYLPQDELAAFGVTESEILESRWSPRMKQLLRFQGLRARHYFAKAHRLMVPGDRPNLVAAEIMRGVYEGLLDKIERRGFDVVNEPVKLGKVEKMWLAWRAGSLEKKAPARPPAPKKVVVLGAGYAGLACAAELVRRGHEVTLLESRALLGGRAHSFTDPKTGLTLDNGQHILMGCYHETLGLLRELGVTDRLQTPSRLHVPYCSERGRHALTAIAPSPLHLASALLHFGELSFADKRAAIGLALRLRLGGNPGPHETVAGWLRRWKQTPNVIRALWEPLCLAALNEPVATGSAALFATVIRRSFLGGPADSTIYLSRVGLSELFAPEIEELLEMCGGAVRVQAPVKALHFAGEKLAEIELADGTCLQPEAVVSALPWHVLRGLLPAESKLAAACRALGDAPIVSLHLWLDRPVLREPFVGFLDSPVHWIFNRDLIQGGATRQPGHVFTAVISGAREVLDQTPAELEELTLREMRRFLPETHAAKVLHRMVYKARSATFAATPEAEELRPGAVTEWSNFWLAGDWTDTGLPATIEGAIVSGNRAARAVDAAVLT